MLDIDTDKQLIIVALIISMFVVAIIVAWLDTNDKDIF